MPFYYTVTYSFDPSRRLVGPFKDEESCWKAMEEDANHEHEEDLRNDMTSIVEKDKDAGEIVIKTPNELDDVPDTTTWSMFDNMETPKNIVNDQCCAIKIVSAAEMSKVIDKPRDNIGLYLSLESNENDIALVACDNSTGNAWVEEFYNTKDAVRWLRRV